MRQVHSASTTACRPSALSLAAILSASALVAYGPDAHADALAGGRVHRLRVGLHAQLLDLGARLAHLGVVEERADLHDEAAAAGGGVGRLGRRRVGQDARRATAWTPRRRRQHRRRRYATRRPGRPARRPRPPRPRRLAGLGGRPGRRHGRGWPRRRDGGARRRRRAALDVNADASDANAERCGRRRRRRLRRPARGADGRAS